MCCHLDSSHLEFNYMVVPTTGTGLTVLQSYIVIAYNWSVFEIKKQVKIQRVNILCLGGLAADFCSLVFSFESQLQLPHLPDMIFSENCLSLQHEHGFGIRFTALEALKCVSLTQDVVQVAGAKEWKEAR